MQHSKGLIPLLFILLFSSGSFADEISHLENPLQFFKKYYTKEQLKEIHKLNMKVLVEIEKKTKYPPKMEKEQARINWMKYAFPLINSANALGINGRCFFGGWMTDQGKTWCHEPWRYSEVQDIKDFGPTYNSEYFCGGKNLFRCNPTIFGMPKKPNPKLGRNPDRGICIKISSYDHVTRKCTEQAMKYLDEFVEELEKDSKGLSSFLKHTAEILRYCEVDKLDYCAKLKEYLELVTKKAAECEKAQAGELLPKVDPPLDADDLDKIVIKLEPTPTPAPTPVKVDKPIPTPIPTAVVTPTPVVTPKPEPTKKPEPTLDDKIAKYSNSYGTQKMIERMRETFTKNCSDKGCIGSKTNIPTGNCWRHVKHGVMAGGYARVYMEDLKVDYPYTRTASAKYAGRDFFDDPKVGFTNLLKTEKYKNMSSTDAPKGAVLVYEGGAHGHIEVKTADKEYISDFRESNPIDASNPYRRTTRKLIGVYVKID
ncbi:MAG: hypothetical protein KC478_15265 [Bacteriovoracaceae bacterium]|nr:hypothetical protein [Bacteriovoracaceae bacterium]